MVPDIWSVATLLSSKIATCESFKIDLIGYEKRPHIAFAEVAKRVEHCLAFYRPIWFISGAMLSQSFLSCVTLISSLPLLSRVDAELIHHLRFFNKVKNSWKWEFEELDKWCARLELSPAWVAPLLPQGSTSTIHYKSLIEKGPNSLLYPNHVSLRTSRFFCIDFNPDIVYIHKVCSHGIQRNLFWTLTSTVSHLKRPRLFL